MSKIQTMAYKQHVDQSVKAVLKCRYQRALEQKYTTENIYSNSLTREQRLLPLQEATDAMSASNYAYDVTYLNTRKLKKTLRARWL